MGSFKKDDARNKNLNGKKNQKINPRNSVPSFDLYPFLPPSQNPRRKRSPLIRTTTKSEKEGNRSPRTQNPSTLPSRLQKPYQTPNAPRLLLYIFHRELLEQIEDNKREKTETRQEDGMNTHP